MIDFTQHHIEINKRTMEALTRTYGHLRRAQASYKKAVGNPFLLSDAVCKRLRDIETNLSSVQ